MKLTRRKRKLAIASVLGLIFLILLFLTFWLLTPQKEEYKPGGEVEGLTDALARSLPEDYPKVRFKNVTATSGIDFKHFYGTRSSQLPEDMGSGVAWGDFNNDGFEDLFIANEKGPLTLDEDESTPATSVLYMNKGDGSFEDVSEEAGVNLWAMAIAPAWGDYNNDGWLDLYVTCFGENKLYKNNGDGTFQELGKRAGVSGTKGFWAGASWGDYNLDGFLDLYVCGYVQYELQKKDDLSLQYGSDVPASINPSSFKPMRNLLFRNNQDGSFTEIAKESGVDDSNGRSLSASWSDLDDDGLPDLYVANDVSDNVLFHNLGNGKFEEISRTALVADYRGAMGIGVGDWDGDLDLDLFITHWIAQENALYSNLHSQTRALSKDMSAQIRFMDEADRYGLGQIALDYIGFGTFFFDYNNDSKLDIFVANGSTFQEKENPELLISMKDQLFWNKGSKNGYFDVSPVSGDYFQDAYGGRGCAYADYDNDGDLDIFIVNNNGPGILLQNEGGNNNSWLKIKLRGTKSNSFAIGTKIRVVSEGKSQIRQVGAQGSYCSQNSLIEHFGLDNTELIDSVLINWSNGEVQSLQGVKVNQTLMIEQGKVQ